MSHFLGFFTFILFIGWILIVLNFLNTQAFLTLLTFSALLWYLLIILIVYLAREHLLFWSYSSIYWFLVMLSFFVFFGLVKSVSVRILFDLLQSPNFTLEYQYLLNEYLIKESYTKRINLLIKNKTVRLRDGKILLTKKGRVLAAAVAKIQKVFLVKESG